MHDFRHDRVDAVVVGEEFRHRFGVLQFHVVRVGGEDMRRAGGRSGERHFPRIPFGESVHVDGFDGAPIFPLSLAERKFLRRGGHGQPVALIAGLRRHGHFAFVPHRAVPALAVGADRDDARAPIAEHFGRVVAAKVCGDFLGAFLGVQANDVSAERFGRFAGGDAIDSLGAIDRFELVAADSQESVPQVQLVFRIKLCLAGVELADQIAHAFDSVFPQASLLTDAGVGVEGRVFVLARDRGHRRQRTVSPVRVVTGEAVEHRRRVEPVEAVSVGSVDVVVILHRFRSADAGVTVGENFATAHVHPPVSVMSMAPLVKQSARSRSARMTQNAATISAARKPVNVLESVLHGSSYGDLILVRLSLIPIRHAAAGEFEIGPEILRRRERALSV